MTTLLVKDTKVWVAGSQGRQTEDMTGRANPSLPTVEAELDERHLVGKSYQWVAPTGLRGALDIQGLLLDEPSPSLQAIFRSADKGFQAFHAITGAPIFWHGNYVCSTNPLSPDGGIWVLNAQSVLHGALLVGTPMDTSSSAADAAHKHVFTVAEQLWPYRVEFAALIAKTIGDTSLGDGHKFTIEVLDSNSSDIYSANIAVPSGSFDDDATFMIWRGVLRRNSDQALIPASGVTGRLQVRNETANSLYNQGESPNVWGYGVPISID